MTEHDYITKYDIAHPDIAFLVYKYCNDIWPELYWEAYSECKDEYGHGISMLEWVAYHVRDNFEEYLEEYAADDPDIDKIINKHRIKVSKSRP